MSSPFIFDIASVADSHNGTETLVNEGPSPQRIGLEMIAIPEGAPVRTEAQVTPLGEGVMVHATVEAQLTGQCVRCLNDLQMDKTFTIDQVFSSSPDFITSESEDIDTDEEDDADAGLGTIVDNTIDLTQAVIDEVGLTLPFNPTCLMVAITKALTCRNRTGYLAKTKINSSTHDGLAWRSSCEPEEEKA